MLLTRQAGELRLVGLELGGEAESRKKPGFLLQASGRAVALLPDMGNPGRCAHLTEEDGGFVPHPVESEVSVGPAYGSVHCAPGNTSTETGVQEEGQMGTLSRRADHSWVSTVSCAEMEEQGPPGSQSRCPHDVTCHGERKLVLVTCREASPRAGQPCREKGSLFLVLEGTGRTRAEGTH